MKILGVTHPISWNNAACLVIDGKLVAMVEEERLIRIKHAPHIFPEKSIQYCLSHASLTLQDLDYIAIGYDSVATLKAAIIDEPIPDWIVEVNHHEIKLREYFCEVEEKLVFVTHHLAHASSAFWGSKYTEANIISLDGSGGFDAGVLAYGQGTNISILHRIPDESSWGRMFELTTESLGFSPHSGEGKTMGLAAYADPSPEGFPFIDWVPNIPVINLQAQDEFFSCKKKRRASEPLNDTHKVLAATAQDQLEKAYAQISRWLYEATGSKNFCLAGGVALNCSANGKLLQMPWVERVFVQPIAQDAGTALGAALFAYAQMTNSRPLPMEHVYWGPEYSSDSIAAALQGATGISYHIEPDICRRVADELANGKVIGWFQGRSEVGPRALGARSILANPSIPEMKKFVNKIKNREDWRPFAPSLLDKYAHKYFADLCDAPYMILAFTALEEGRKELVSALHVDNTGRPQVVAREINPRYWSLICEFHKITGVPALLNTSFNLASEPMVNSPQDAISTFQRSAMDYLAIGDFFVRKDKSACG